VNPVQRTPGARQRRHAGPADGTRLAAFCAQSRDCGRAKEDTMANPDQGAGNGSGRRRRGFAGMDPQRQREIAAMGGRAAHRSGHAHEFDSAEATRAGRKGGLMTGLHRQAARALATGGADS
jgi:general stress protein YciG